MPTSSKKDALQDAVFPYPGTSPHVRPSELGAKATGKGYIRGESAADDADLDDTRRSLNAGNTIINRRLKDAGVDYQSPMYNKGGMVKAGSPTRCAMSKGSKQLSCK